MVPWPWCRLVAAVGVLLALDVRVASGRCFDDSAAGQKTMREVLEGSIAGCPSTSTTATDEKSSTNRTVVLAYRGWRSQQVNTEIVAWMLEDFLNMDVVFRDLRDWPPYKEYQSDCSWEPSPDCVDEFVYVGKRGKAQKTYYGCAVLGDRTRPLCSRVSILGGDLEGSNETSECYLWCDSKANLCYDVDVEVAYPSISSFASTQTQAAASQWGWAIDVGKAGYLIRPGLFFWPSTIQPNRGDFLGPQMDWYTFYMNATQVLSIFKPLPGVAKIAADRGPCTSQWNKWNAVNCADTVGYVDPWGYACSAWQGYDCFKATQEFGYTKQEEKEIYTNCPVSCDICELYNPDKWCRDGSFIPKHCNQCTDCCGEIYHVTPAFMTGEVEAIVVSYRLPFRVVYLSEQDYANLTSYGEPFVAFGDKFQGHSFLDVVKITFPIMPQANHAEGACNMYYTGNPQQPHFCDVPDYEPRKYASRSMREAFPAVFMAIDRSHINSTAMEEMALLDHKIKRDQIKINDSIACQFIRNNSDSIRHNLQYCELGNQPIDVSAVGRCLCSPGTYLNTTAGRCLECPVNHYCRGMSFPPTRCGNYSESDTGASSADDCLCIPGYGRFRIDFRCTPCQQGFFKDWRGNSICSRCQALSMSPAASTHQLFCMCQQGHFLRSSSDFRCSACHALLNGADGASCPGYDDLESMSRLPSDQPGYWQGPFGLPHKLPSAKVGYFMIDRGRIDEAGGSSPVFLDCTVAGACLGENLCREGMEGFLCGKCKAGWARGHAGALCSKCQLSYMIPFLVLFQALLVYVAILLAGTMTRHAVMHMQIITVLFKIAVHLVIVTAPLREIAHIWEPLQYLWFPSMLPSWIWLSIGCLLDAMDIKEFYTLTVAAVAFIVVWPMFILLLLGIMFVVVKSVRHEEVVKLQYEVRALEGLIRLCDHMCDLRVEDVLGGTHRMDNLKHELEGYLEDRVYKSRICRIWRTVYREFDIPDVWHDIRLFVGDSSNIIIVIEIALYSLICPKLAAPLIQTSYKRFSSIRGSQEDVGQAVVYSDPEVEFLSSSHTLVFILGGLFTIVYSLALPVLNYAIVYKYRHDLADVEVGRRIGWLFHGFQISPPFCYGEVFLLLQRLYVSIVCEGFLSSQGRALMYSVAAVASLMVHVWWSPYEKQHYRMLNFFETWALVTWVLIAAAYEQLGADVMNKDNLSNVAVYDRVIITVMVIAYGLFWLGFCWLVIRELRHRIYRKVSTRRQVEGFEQFDSTKHVRRPSCLDNFLEWVHDQELAFRGGYLKISMRTRTRFMNDQTKKQMREMLLTTGDGPSELDLMDPAVLIREVSSNISAKPSKKTMSQVNKSTSIVKKSLSVSTNKSLHRDGTIELRKFYCHPYDLSAIPDVISEALNILMVTHRFSRLPFCAIDFVLWDAMHYYFDRQAYEAPQREAIFHYILNHEFGVELGITDIFNGVAELPHGGRSKRAEYLTQAARGEMGNSGEQLLTVRILEIYNVYLQCERTEVITRFLELYSKEVYQRYHRKKRRHVVEHCDVGTQTFFFANQSTQTDRSTANKSTSTAVDQAKDADPNKTYSTRSPSKEQIERQMDPSGDRHMEKFEMQEAAAVADRETELLKEELFRVCDRLPVTQSRGLQTIRETSM